MTRRLLLSYVVLTLGVLIALELPLGILNAHNLRQDLRSKVQRDAVTLGSLAEDALEHRRPADPNVRAAVAATRRRPTRTSWCARRRAGRRRLGRCGDDDAEHVTRSRRHEPVAANGRVFGTVAITYPTSSTDRRIVRDWIGLGDRGCRRPRRRRSARPAALALALAAVASGRAAAQRIGDGELDARAPESDGPDDVAGSRAR